MKKKLIAGREPQRFSPWLKRLLIMKMLVILLLVVGLTSSYAESDAQTTKVNLKLKSGTVKDVIQEIERQTDLSFMYDNNVFKVDRPVSINVENATVKSVVEKLISGEDLKYEMVNRYIVITANNTPSAFSQQQQKSVSGKVTDSSGASLPGVTVVVKGTTNGTITDANGFYSLTKIPDNSTLVFSFVGMKKQEVAVAGKSTVNVKMEEDAIGIEEVVAVGYGTQKKINLTGAVDVVQGEKLADRPAQNVTSLLQGISPNLNITTGDRGGEPGSSMNINIRGIGTISGNDNPLILVDGVEMNINNIDPDDVESVSILKDAASSAIYGSRAPFGVVLIITKKGKKNQPMTLKYSNEFSYSNPIALPRFVSSLEWVTAYNQACANAGLADRYPAEQVQRIKDYMAGTLKAEYDVNKPPTSIWGSRWQGNANYDWPSLYYKKNSPSQSHNINVQGGTDKTQYFISANYYSQDGLWNWHNDTYKRYNVMANFSTQVTPWIRFDFSSKYAKSEQNKVLGLNGGSDTGIWLNMINFGPMQSYYNVNGTVNNPLVAYLQGTGMNLWTNDDSWITLATELEPVKGWKTKVSYNYNYQQFTRLQNPRVIMVEVPNGTFGNDGFASNGFRRTMATTYYNLANAVTSYEKTIGHHYFKVLAGYEQELNKYSQLEGRRDGLITNEVPSISTATNEASTFLDDGASQWANQAFFGRINYNYKEKYLVEFNGRNNGSSRFAPGSRWGLFPSVSAGYNISKENFWKAAEPYVNTLKLRGSYGSLGNQNVANYLYLATLPVSSNLNYLIDNQRPLYAGVPGIISSNLTWEKITSLNFGLDAGFLKNRLNLNFDWYNRITSDMFGPAEELPSVLGTGAPQANNAKLSTKGYEITLSWKDVISSGFSYNVGFVLGDNRTKILEYKNDNNLIDTYYPGKILGEVWGYTTDKIMQTADDVAAMPDQSKFFSKWYPGDIAYKDLTGDGIINDGKRTLDDHGDLSRIANTSPRYNFGITAGFNWKGFDFNMLWQGIAKRDYSTYSNDLMFWGFKQGGSPGSESTLLSNGWMMDYWRPADETNILGPNTGAYFPRPTWNRNEIPKNHQTQTRYIVSQAYMRLKNIQLGYTVPGSISKKVSLQKVRIYFSGADLLTFKKLPGNIDPDNLSLYPLSAIYSFGINVTF